MPIQLDADLPAPLIPLAWLVGTWAGAGVVGYPTMESDQRFGQEIDVQPRRPAVPRPTARRPGCWTTRAGRCAPLASETGYWRPSAAPEGRRHRPGGLLAHPTGIVEVYLGEADGPRITLQTDAVVRTTTAKEYSAATRMYGLVEGDLLWVMDMAAVGQAADLARVGPPQARAAADG